MHFKVKDLEDIIYEEITNYNTTTSLQIQSLNEEGDPPEGESLLQRAERKAQEIRDDAKARQDKKAARKKEEDDEWYGAYLLRSPFSDKKTFYKWLGTAGFAIFGARAYMGKYKSRAAVAKRSDKLHKNAEGQLSHGAGSIAATHPAWRRTLTDIETSYNNLKLEFDNLVRGITARGERGMAQRLGAKGVVTNAEFESLKSHLVAALQKHKDVLQAAGTEARVAAQSRAGATMYTKVEQKQLEKFATYTDEAASINAKMQYTVMNAPTAGELHLTALAISTGGKQAQSTILNWMSQNGTFIPGVGWVTRVSTGREASFKLPGIFDKQTWERLLTARSLVGKGGQLLSKIFLGKFARFLLAAGGSLFVLDYGVPRFAHFIKKHGAPDWLVNAVFWTAQKINFPATAIMRMIGIGKAAEDLVKKGPIGAMAIGQVNTWTDPATRGMAVRQIMAVGIYIKLWLSKDRYDQWKTNLRAFLPALFKAIARDHLIKEAQGWELAKQHAIEVAGKTPIKGARGDVSTFFKLIQSDNTDIAAEIIRTYLIDYPAWLEGESTKSLKLTGEPDEQKKKSPHELGGEIKNDIKEMQDMNMQIWVQVVVDKIYLISKKAEEAGEVANPKLKQLYPDLMAVINEHEKEHGKMDPRAKRTSGKSPFKYCQLLAKYFIAPVDRLKLRKNLHPAVKDLASKTTHVCLKKEILKFRGGPIKDHEFVQTVKQFFGPEFNAGLVKGRRRNAYEVGRDLHSILKGVVKALEEESEF